MMIREKEEFLETALKLIGLVDQEAVSSQTAQYDDTATQFFFIDLLSRLMMAEDIARGKVTVPDAERKLQQFAKRHADLESQLVQLLDSEKEALTRRQRLRVIQSQKQG